ncbi:MAG: flippase-like domain-containing protein, partial [Dehalococcoidia bacterium]|nr:flippase-like domain-containing protein [Dehalococcoidia bacterium]
MSGKLRIVLSFAVTAVMLFLALRGVDDFSQIGRSLAQANLWWAAPAVACSATAYVLRAFRWQRLLAPAKRMPFGAVYATLMLGFAANNVLPARIGEIVRAVQMGRKAAISRTLCFSTVAV